MTVSVVATRAATALTMGEIREVSRLAGEYGRATLLVDGYAVGEACRRGLADAGVGIGVDVLTPAAWLAGLWELLGDGRQLVDDQTRRLIMADVVADAARSDADALLPLKDNAGTVSMLCEMVRACPLDALESDAERYLHSRAEFKSAELLTRYHGRLSDFCLVEASSAAVELARQFRSARPACTRAVVVRGVSRLPEYLLRLLESVVDGGEVVFLYNAWQRPMAEELAGRYAVTVDELPDAVGAPHAAAGAEGGAAVASGMPAPTGADAGAVHPSPAFAEVCGPTARFAAYAGLIERAAARSPHRTVVIAAPDPLGLFRGLAPRLAARGLAARVEAFTRFPETRAGQAFFQLIDFIDRLDNQEASAWWPAPELADWLRSPFAGLGAAGRYAAVALDTQLRRNRSLTREKLHAQLASLQSRERNRERERAEQRGCPPHQVVLKDVIDAIDARRYPQALRLMYEAARSLGPAAFGAEGFAACQAELAALQAACDVFERARELGVSADSALQALEGLSLRVVMESTPTPASSDEDAETGPTTESLDEFAWDGGHGAPCIQIMRLDALAALGPVSCDAMLWLDADAASHPLAMRETASSRFLAAMGFAGIVMPAAARQRDCVHRALCAASREAVFAYVAHDNEAAERFPALTYAELRAAADADRDVLRDLPGEGALFANLDAAAGAGMQIDNRPRRAEHALPEELAPYLLLTTRCLNGHPVTRTLSASQIENYLACPYRWFVNNRVSTRRLDAEFGPIERGNLSHDVMQRFYERLGECGLTRVTPLNIDRCLEEMDASFDEIREDHERGKYTHGRYAAEERPRPVRGGLVALDRLERGRIDAMRSRFHEVVRHDAEMLPLYAPSSLEYSFDKEGVTYAGRPLGGRIDRVDTAPDAGSGERFAVIDYKTGASVDAMRVLDPTLSLGDGEQLDERWLPGRDKDKAPKVQTLMYATALERAHGGSAQAAVYYGLRGPAIAGAVSSALAESEPCQLPGAKVGAFPGTGGTKAEPRYGSMDFEALLTQVEHAISLELDRLEAGDIAPRPASDSCAYCPLKMCEKRR